MQVQYYDGMLVYRPCKKTIFQTDQWEYQQNNRLKNGNVIVSYYFIIKSVIYID